LHAGLAWQQRVTDQHRVSPDLGRLQRGAFPTQQIVMKGLVHHDAVALDANQPAPIVGGPGDIQLRGGSLWSRHEAVVTVNGEKAMRGSRPRIS
jgi:hypothetical protein